jgi:hypothetical protein
MYELSKNASVTWSKEFKVELKNRKQKFTDLYTKWNPLFSTYENLIQKRVTELILEKNKQELAALEKDAENQINTYSSKDKDINYAPNNNNLILNDLIVAQENAKKWEIYQSLIQNSTKFGSNNSALGDATTKLKDSLAALAIVLAKIKDEDDQMTIKIVEAEAEKLDNNSDIGITDQKVKDLVKYRPVNIQPDQNLLTSQLNFIKILYKIQELGNKKFNNDKTKNDAIDKYSLNVVYDDMQANITRVKLEDEKKKHENDWNKVPKSVREWLASSTMDNFITKSATVLSELKIYGNVVTDKTKFGTYASITQVVNDSTIDENYSSGTQFYIGDWSLDDLKNNWTQYVQHLAWNHQASGLKNWPEQPTRVSINDNWININAKTPPVIAPNTNTMFNKDIVVWKNNSCWADSTFMSLFGYTGNTLIDDIFGRTQLLKGKKKVIQFVGRTKDIDYQTIFTEPEKLHNVIIEDIKIMHNTQPTCLGLGQDLNNYVPTNYQSDINNTLEVEKLLEFFRDFYTSKKLQISTFNYMNNVNDIQTEIDKVNNVAKNIDIYVLSIYVDANFKNQTEDMTLMFQKRLNLQDFICCSIIAYSSAHFITFMYDFMLQKWVYMNILENSIRKTLNNGLPDKMFDYRVPNKNLPKDIDDRIEITPCTFFYYRKDALEKILKQKNNNTQGLSTLKNPGKEYFGPFYVPPTPSVTWPISTPIDVKELAKKLDESTMANLNDYKALIGYKNGQFSSKLLQEPAYNYALYWLNEYLKAGKKDLNAEFNIKKAIKSLNLDYVIPKKLGIFPRERDDIELEKMHVLYNEKGRSTDSTIRLIKFLQQNRN